MQWTPGEPAPGASAPFPCLAAALDTIIHVLVPFLPLTCSMATSYLGWGNTWPISNHTELERLSSSQAMRVESAKLNPGWVASGRVPPTRGCPDGVAEPGDPQPRCQRGDGRGPEPPRLKPLRCGGGCATVSGSVVTQVPGHPSLLPTAELSHGRCMFPGSVQSFCWIRA